MFCPHGLSDRLRQNSEPSSPLNAFAHILFGVELEKAETTSTSRSIRTTCAKSFALLRSSDSFLNAFSRILGVEFAKAEAQAFRVLSARSFRPLTAKQRTVIASKRFCSHPNCSSMLLIVLIVLRKHRKRRISSLSSSYQRLLFS